MSKITWQIASSTDKSYIIELAKLKGWAENKVQVKRIQMDEVWWVLEPFEESCTCPEIVNPENYRVKNNAI